MKKSNYHEFNKMKRLENKTVFITGGLSGIGKACPIAAFIECDISVFKQVESAIQQVIQTFSSLRLPPDLFFSHLKKVHL